MYSLLVQICSVHTLDAWMAGVHIKYCGLECWEGMCVHCAGQWTQLAFPQVKLHTHTNIITDILFIHKQMYPTSAHTHTHTHTHYRESHIPQKTHICRSLNLSPIHKGFLFSIVLPAYQLFYYKILWIKWKSHSSQPKGTTFIKIGLSLFEQQTFRSCIIQQVLVHVNGKSIC